LTLISLFSLLLILALVLYLIRFWPRLAFLVILFATAQLVLNTLKASTNSLDILSVTLTLEAAPRDFLTVGLGLTGLLALATLFQRDRVSLGFLFWSWAPWFIALVVNDFVVAVFAWTLGLVVAVFGMKPRKFHRASGAAYFLVVIVVALASLLLANRFIALYPLTPERTTLIQFAVVFLCLGFGLYFSLAPFHFWVGPMTDDAPLPTAAAVLALGQPIGLWLLFKLLNQTLWLSDKSNLFELMGLGGAATIIVGGLMAAVERRGGRMLGYAAIFTLGFALLDLSRATREGLAYSGLEILSRAVGLTALACAITIGREVKHPAARRIALAVSLLAGLSLVGLRLGVGLSERWNILLQLVGTDQRLFVLLILAHLGLLVGVIRFAGQWFEEDEARAERETEIAAPITRQLVYRRETVAVPAAVAELSRVEAGEGHADGEESTREPAVMGPLSEEARGELHVEDELTTEGNGTDQDNGGEALEPVATEEYVFEEHVGEIVRTLVERARPHLRQASRSLPAGTIGLLALIWNTWRLWASIALLAALVALLLAVGFVPGLWFDHAVASFGQPAFIQ
jgi:NADH:ubiquinone oxidoreductase subunit 2 (subunit N)